MLEKLEIKTLKINYNENKTHYASTKKLKVSRPVKRFWGKESSSCVQKKVRGDFENFDYPTYVTRSRPISGTFCKLKP